MPLRRTRCMSSPSWNYALGQVGFWSIIQKFCNGFQSSLSYDCWHPTNEQTCVTVWWWSESRSGSSNALQMIFKKLCCPNSRSLKSSPSQFFNLEIRRILVSLLKRFEMQTRSWMSVEILVVMIRSGQFR